MTCGCEVIFSCLEIFVLGGIKGIRDITEGKHQEMCRRRITGKKEEEDGEEEEEEEENNRVKEQNRERTEQISERKNKRKS